MVLCEERWKKVAVVMLAGISIFLFLPTFAAGGEAIRTFCQSMVEDIFDMDALTSVTTLLTEDITTTYSALWTITQNLVDNVVIPTAYGICVVYLVITFINIAMQPQQATAVQFFKPFAWWVVAVFLIWFTPNIISFGVGFAGQFAAELVDTATAGADVAGYSEAICDYFDTYITGLAKGIIVVGELVFPWLAAKFAGIIIQCMAYVAIIELFVRAIFMPLSFGPMIMHGFSAEGTRYLRAFIACGLRIALMVAMGIIVTYLIAGMLPTDDISALDYASDTIKIIFIDIAFIFALKKCGDIANEIMGV